MQANDGNDWGDFSTPFSFTNGPSAGADSTLPEAPQLTSPPDNSFQENEDIVFSWNVVNGATDYNFQLAFDQNFNSVSLDLNTGGATSQLLLDFPQDSTTYYWRVRAQNSNGWSAFSTPFSFTSIPSGGDTLTVGIPVLVFPPNVSYQDTTLSLIHI